MGILHSDRYYTPEPIADVIVKSYLKYISNQNVLDVCSGTGAFTKALLNNDIKPSNIYSIDNDPLSTQTNLIPSTNHYHSNILEWINSDNITVAIGNPPYQLAHTIVDHLLDQQVTRVIFLLRLSFLEPANNRVHLLSGGSRGVWTVQPLKRRPRWVDCKGNQLYTNTDSVGSALFYWSLYAPSDVPTHLLHPL